MAKIGVIGGSGLYEIKGLTIKKSRKLATPYGKPSDEYRIGMFGDAEVVFLPRHGAHHGIPPHMVNYRANIYGFKKLGVERIISVSAVGGIKKGLKPGDIVIGDKIIDMTRNRKNTFYDGKEGRNRLVPRVVHIDFTEPYCTEMRGLLLKAGRRARVRLIKSGTYIAVEGPRLETASEIKAFGILGADIVGMTGMPEAALARELEICYSSIALVANYAAGIKKQKLTVAEVLEAMKSSVEKIKNLLKETFRLLPEKRKCPCKDALKEAKI
ncbi:MAG: S-methyl-5'-thioadenosine phosphorylase [Nitrospirae bacterium]|nr:S-methyl-5'-thioadenosine phosphorylase [Nitrospirota bacterium]